jgi:hypothetical protein
MSQEKSKATAQVQEIVSQEMNGAFSYPFAIDYEILYDPETAREFREELKEAEAEINAIASGEQSPFNLRVQVEAEVTMILQLVDRAANISSRLLEVSNSSFAKGLSNSYTRISDSMSLLNNYAAMISGK